MITSVCSGALFLAEIGLLSGKKATTNWALFDYLQHKYPKIQVIRDVKYVDEGKIVTSAGATAGINMVLYVVERLQKEAQKQNGNLIFLDISQKIEI